MRNRSKGKNKTNYSPWSSRLEVGGGAKEPAPKEFTLTKYLGNHRGGQDPQRVVATVKENSREDTTYYGI
jgi:hypothetical protein